MSSATAPLLLCTDLDRTLLPNGEAPESPGARERFAALVAHPEITLAYVSGRHLELVEQAIEQFGIPRPDWVISDVGSRLYQWQPPGQWLESAAWQAEISRDWPGLSSGDISEVLSSLGGLSLQGQDRQSTYKLSYVLPLGVDLASLRQEMEARLQPLKARSSWIYSVDEQAQIGLLDILPERATKLHAVEFLMRQQGFAPTSTVFAGDSGNDLPILVSSVPSVLVANAHPDVLQQAQDGSRQGGTSQQLYLAKGDFLGMNGHYSAGILEGLVHFHPDTRAWIS
ncbi:HAD-IIB family hydrolase [Synechococcus sp. CS-1329]|jgi:sucrose-6-phosphatase|uniref:HAD-IIB family hydrolase n=1 Tax=Synechococcus sp. CS-1329 TaxID=2847975 RepID=UPI00223B64DF|nr:HAD-IIB family hydrolase [Synechococcus sp. CS-1329]MCT0217641.1 HAD-IIB family hydrolase [Synechococcus sp. CS-1329]